MTAINDTINRSTATYAAQARISHNATTGSSFGAQMAAKQKNGTDAFANLEQEQDTRMAICERLERDYLTYMQMHATASTPYTPVQLTKTQKQELAAAFHSNTMNQQEYEQFVDKLCHYGILDESDKPHISCKSSAVPDGLTLVDGVNYRSCVAYMDAPYNQLERVHLESPRDSWGGYSNILEWAKQEASARRWNPLTGSYFRDEKQTAFQKIAEALQQLNLVD